MSWTSQTFLNLAIDRLRKAHVKNPRLDGELLLAHALNCNRTQIFMEPDRIINQNEFNRCQHFLDRRVRREPIHYILNWREFWSRNFRVTSGVLIPRPETEFLIQSLLELNTQSTDSSSPIILDVGTGSGNLAVTAALELPACKVTSVDLSRDALETARYNATMHGVENKIQFLPGDIFSDTVYETLDTYDFILCNPPYIPSFQVQQLMPEVRSFEPLQALDGGPDGLSFYRRLIPKTVGWLKPKGYLILEIGDKQWLAVSEMLSQYFECFHFVFDYANKPRAVFAKKQAHGKN